MASQDTEYDAAFPISASTAFQAAATEQSGSVLEPYIYTQ